MTAAQTNGPLTDPNGDLLVDGIKVRSDLESALVLEQGEVGYATDSKVLLVGDGLSNIPVGLTSARHFDVIPGEDAAVNGTALLAAYTAAENYAGTVPACRGIAGTISDASIADGLTEASIDVVDGTKFQEGAIYRFGTDGAQNGAFDSTTFSSERLRCGSVLGNTVNFERQFGGSTGTSISDGVDLYRLEDSAKPELRLWGGEYELASTWTIDNDAVRVVGVEGSSNTFVYINQRGGVNQVRAVTLQNGVGLIQGLTMDIRNEDGVADDSSLRSDRALNFNACAYGHLRDVRVREVGDLAEGFSSTNAFFAVGGDLGKQIEGGAVGLVVLEDYEVIGKLDLNTKGNVELRRARLDLGSTSGIFNASTPLVGGGAYTWKAYDSWFSAGSDIIQDTEENFTYTAYNCTFISTVSARTMEINDAVPLRFAHCRLSHQPAGSGTNTTLDQWNLIAAGNNVVDAGVV